MHHILMAMPLLALVLFLFLPWPVALAAYIPLVTISMLGYWKVLKAQLQPPASGPSRMIGGRAVIIEVRKGKLEVRYQGEIWRAVATEPVQRGQAVIIEGREGLTLQVRPLARSVADAQPQESNLVERDEPGESKA